ncbi:hypothetical protein [Citrobacter koseri]|uniref:hypothetical protein n=1 Tax=Citrobacter koseri TaxID=545 RepID=UPI0019067D96|nr:hypothetical protein [Citrobacter koseri]MBJ8867695.1 hypothetical protein [Citrobacter koseri]
MKSTVETKIIELVKSGHELAKELHCAESAALVSDLASQLEVQFARSNALAAKLSMINGLMDAAEQANKLAQEATEKLVQERDALAAENAGLKAFGDKLYSMYKGLETSGGGLHDEQSIPYQQAALDAAMSAFEEIEIPSTSAFLAEVRASCVDAVKQKISDAISGCYQDEMAGLDAAVNIASEFAAQLRKGGAA